MSKITFLGEYQCSVDDKGRVRMPAELRKQFPEGDKGRFMLAKGLDDCLMIYPLETWSLHEARLRKLNRFNPEHRAFINAFTVGLMQTELDGNDRFLLPKSLSRYIGAPREVVLKADLDQIQVWDIQKYEQYTQGNIAQVEALSDKVARYLDSLDEGSRP